MCQKKLKRKKTFFSSLSCGLPQITLLLMVCWLGLSPLAALPWRAVSKLDLRDQVQSKSDPMEISQQTSLQNSNEASNQASTQTLPVKQVLKNVDGLLVDISKDQIQSDADLAEQIFLTEELAKDNKVVTDQAAQKASDYNKLATKYQKLEKKVNSAKTITEVTGSYNHATGFGVGAAVGIKSKHGATMKAGVSIPVSAIGNPSELTKIDSYTFNTTLGYEW